MTLPFISARAVAGLPHRSDALQEFARALEEAIMNGEGEGGFGEVSGDEEEEGFWY